MQPSRFTFRKIQAADLLSQVEALVPEASFVTQLPWDGWQSHKYLEFAKCDIEQRDERGWLNAITNAKRAVCCRIDQLLSANYLFTFERDFYPAKIEALKKVGVNAPDVIHGLVIDPRNQEEHDYRPADSQRSKEAVEIAELFIIATKGEHERPSVLTIGRLIKFYLYCGPSELRFRFTEKPAGAMLLVDLETAPKRIRIINFEELTIDQCDFAALAKAESLQLSRVLRDPLHCGNSTHLPFEAMSHVKREIGLASND